MRAHWPGLLVRVTRSGPGKMTGVTMVYLVQHGDKERLPGDPGLTALGRQQATRTGRWMSNCGVRALWTSPMRRARETADCIAAVTGLAVQPDARLRERLNWDGGMPFHAFLALCAHHARPRPGTRGRPVIPAGNGPAAGLPGQPARPARTGRGGHPRRNHD